MHNAIHSCFVSKVSLFLAVLLACRGAAAQEQFEGWNLEPGVSQAHLVMVARVARVSRVTVVEGAKTDVALREYRFQPVRRLKGIFQREELSMTAADLGCPPEDAASAPPLKEGEFRLLILVQPPGASSMGCVSAAPGATTFEQRVPLLTGPDDPLVAAVETLIYVADSRSRRERATLLLDRLSNTDSLAAVPLLTSLRLRADWAVMEERAYGVLIRLLRNPSSAVRGAALEVVRDMLASRVMPNDPTQLDGLAASLPAILDSDEPNTSVRLAALDALNNLLALKSDIDWPLEMLVRQLTEAATHVERAAAVMALSRIAHPDAVAAVLDALAALPLDEAPTRESVYARAAVRADAARAERVLLTRLQRSSAARQSIEAEVVVLGRLRSKDSLPLLLAAAGRLNLLHVDRHYIAWALGQVGDDRAIFVLAEWLRRDDYQVKEVALAALENIDSQVAAREARPLLKSEPHLPYKLRFARLLARHGLADGYALATEHLADDGHTAAAALVLVALDDPRTSNDLSAILTARPDRRWHAATLTGLAASGDAAARAQLLEILTDARSALATDASAAVGLAGDPTLLPPLAALVRSRNKQIAITSLVALRRYLSDVRTSPRGLAAVDLYAIHEDSLEWDDARQDDEDLHPPIVDFPADVRAAIAEAVASLVVDAYVDADLRSEAFAVMRLLGGERYDQLLSELADQAELEGTPLLADVQAERCRSQSRRKQT